MASSSQMGRPSHQLGEIRQRPGQPVDLVDHHHVNSSGPDIGQELLERRAVGRHCGRRRRTGLVIDEQEAERVRSIFQRYLELGSIGRLLADLRGRGIVTKVRRLANGRTIGGIPFTRGPLAHLLRNRFYIGEVAYKRSAQRYMEAAGP
jgi:hypothetical protein